MAEPWRLLVRQGDAALLEARFRACERLAARAAELAPGEAAPRLLAVAARREQGRAAEAELLARDVVAGHPDAPAAQALLGAVLADLGRDAEAGRQLDRVDVHRCPANADATALVPGALAAEVAAVLNATGPAEALYRLLAPRADGFVPVTGAVARHVALLCHVLGRWDEAESHFEVALHANRAAGAPVLVAHTQRQYSALLRARGDDGDWERAIDLLAEAALVYRRLEIDRLCEESEAVLRRSQERGGDPPLATAANVFRPTVAGWELSYEGRSAIVPDSAGMTHLASLLAADGRPVHAVDLALGAGRDGTPVPGAAVGDRLRDQVVAEYGDRLAELERHPAAVDGGDAALAEAERDLLAAELTVATAGAPAAGEVGDRARRLVAMRIRIAVDRVEEALPALGRHLRRSIRTGTFCLYEPDRPERWQVGS